MAMLEIKDIAVYELLTLFSALSLFLAVRNSWLSINAFYAAFTGVVLLFVIGLWFVHLSFQRYSKAMFFLAAYPLLSARDALKLSYRDDEKSDRRLTAFKASFFAYVVENSFQNSGSGFPTRHLIPCTVPSAPTPTKDLKFSTSGNTEQTF